MSDLHQGKLVVRAVKKGKQVLIQLPSKKGSHQLPVNQESALSADLRALPLDQLNGLEVECELENNHPVRVRRKGQPWHGPGPTAEEPGRGARGPGGAQQRPGAPGDQRQRGSEIRFQSGGQPQGQAAAPKPDFHNPYNFIPALPREGVSGELGDREPFGHHRHHPNLWSGCITARLTTETPLLIPDAALVATDNGHKTYPARLTADGKPYLAPTSIKGMLRAAYEAATNSRMGVFAGHERPLAFRREARIDVEPARVVQATSEQVEIQVLRQRWLRSPAKLPCYDRTSAEHDRGRSRTGLRYPSGRLPAHGDHVWVQVERNGRVGAVRPFELACPGQDWHEGWACISNPNINNKAYERVFVVSGNDEVIVASNADALCLHRLWSDLIHDYQNLHQRDLQRRRERHENPWDYLGDEPGRTAWSRHIYTPEDVRLRDGTLCYVRRSQGRIIGIYPVAISRDLFGVSPEALLPAANCLRPTRSLSELSPADRVFGWVNQEGSQAYRGNLRVGPVTCADWPGRDQGQEPLAKFPDRGLPLAILGQPKPHQVRFYVAKNDKGEPLDPGDAAPEKKDCYFEGQGLRGRKVYPHHARLPEAYWDNPTQHRTQTAIGKQYQEYRRPQKDGQEQRDDQNRSVTAWVKPGTVFSFDIQITNLSDVELGALLWLLNLNERTTPPKYFHRLGGGKPLGFGSVRLEIEGLELRDGEAWASWYRSLRGVTSQGRAIHALSAGGFAACVEAFRRAVQDAYGKGRDLEDIPFIQAFLRAAQGFADGLPVHYPRVSASPDPEGENFEWFVRNEKRENRHSLGPLYYPDSGPSPALPRLS